MVEVRWTVQSLEDIENIAKYISKDSIRYAEVQVEDFFDSVILLEKFPKAGRIVPEVNDKDLRELIVGFYRIIYGILSENRIDILTVYHTSRKLGKEKIKTLK